MEMRKTSAARGCGSRSWASALRRCGRASMVRGDPADQERAVARALEAGVNYFDTAVAYGDGESERNLGRLFHKLKPANAIVGTKVRLPSTEFGRIGEAVGRSLDGSLQRLGLERVDILHLHNEITRTGGEAEFAEHRAGAARGRVRFRRAAPARQGALPRPDRHRRHRGHSTR